MQSIMLYWQQNWQMGMAISCSVVSISYIIISLLILFKVRKIGGDICCTAFIPFIQLIQLVKYKGRYKKKVKRLRISQEIEDLENEEVDL